MIIEPVSEFEGGDPQWFFTKGHVPPAQFLEHLSTQLGTQYSADDLKVFHSYARWIPVGPDMPGETCIHFDQEPGRGAFPMTYVELGYGSNDPRG